MLGELDILKAIEAKVLWLSSWMIHNANHIRPNSDGVKVGGHQASCASAVSIMTALYFRALRPEDRIAVKPHASPVLHAINYLLGRQTLENLQNFRGLGGAQAYPSRTKDMGGIDFSTGSVGLGAAATLFASMIQDYLASHNMMPDGSPTGRMVAIVGDAELDEGNVFEALLEGWKQDVRNLWWVIDYNRQSLDGVVNDHLFQKITQFFETVGWRVVNLKYGKRLQEAFEGPAGGALKNWIDACPNQLYSALTFKGADAWRGHLRTDLKGSLGFSEFLDIHDDAALHALMTNLGGHDLEYLIDTFDAVRDETPRCFIAYTIKGYGLPIAGHKDNHAGLMTPEQMAIFRTANHVPEGSEWEPFAGLGIGPEILDKFLHDVPYRAKPASSVRSPLIRRPPALAPRAARTSTQAVFGDILKELGDSKDVLADYIVTASPDVAVSTNLGAWINQRAIYHRHAQSDIFHQENLLSPLKWTMRPGGQHIELGIAEHNLFLLLGVLGLSEDLFGVRLLPIGTVYDPFVNRGLDALIYACYQNARFMVAGTPSGISLAPEGGAHQSINTPLIGISIPGLNAFEPAFADELAVLVRWGLEHMQRQNGGAVYLRLSTRPLDQPKRALTDALAGDIIAGGYWREAPAGDAQIVIVYAGAVAVEAAAAQANLRKEFPGAGLLAVTSADRLHQDWLESGAAAHIARLLDQVSPQAKLITVIDGHPLSLSWLGGVMGHRVAALGTSSFGQSASLDALYRVQGIDTASIESAAKS
ncbi:MAG: 1-deoxy-D-xylulose-5-phosphate synthase N-terminal domain-containing protein [Rhodospirillales bacterium]